MKRVAIAFCVVVMIGLAWLLHATWASIGNAWSDPKMSEAIFGTVAKMGDEVGRGMAKRAIHDLSGR